MSLNVLVAEDSELNYEVLADCLGMGGHEVTWARDGEQALALLKERQFDLVLLDLHMPFIDGLNVLKSVRRTRATEHVTVIILTADAMPEVRAKSLAAGADAFLAKPLDLDQLATTIKMVTGADAGCGSARS